MAGLKTKRGAAPQQAAGTPPAMDASRMDIPGMLAKQLNLPLPAVMQLLQQLTTSKNPQEAVEMLKNANRNPATMGQDAPAPAAQAPAQPPAQGLRLPQ